MNIFLQELAKQIGENRVIVVMDGAGWHKSKGLHVPLNIEIVYLPPYSPELNPVERLWQYIKRNTIRNRVYESIKCLEDNVCQFVANIRSDRLASVCSCDYLSN
jgi:transposase